MGGPSVPGLAQPPFGGEGGQRQQPPARPDGGEHGGHPGDVEGRGGQHQGLVLAGPGELHRLHDVGEEIVVGEHRRLGGPRRAAGEEDDRRGVRLVDVGGAVVVTGGLQALEPGTGGDAHAVAQAAGQLVGGHRERPVEPPDLGAERGVGEAEVEGGVGRPAPGGAEQGRRDGPGAGVGEGQGAGRPVGELDGGRAGQGPEPVVGQVPAIVGERDAVAEGVGGQVEQHGDVHVRPPSGAPAVQSAGVRRRGAGPAPG